MSPGQEEAVSEAEEEKKALIRRLLEAYATGDLDTLDELLAPDYVDHNPQPDQVPDREGFIRSLARHESAFSDTRVTTEYQVVDNVTDKLWESDRNHAAHPREMLDLLCVAD